jgi:hypothetical protein
MYYYALQVPVYNVISNIPPCKLQQKKTLYEIGASLHMLSNVFKMFFVAKVTLPKE